MPSTVYETTVNNDVSNIVLMKRVSVRLYWIAVASNMLAFGILLRGGLVSVGRRSTSLGSYAHCDLNDLLVGLFPNAEQVK